MIGTYFDTVDEPLHFRLYPRSPGRALAIYQADISFRTGATGYREITGLAVVYHLPANAGSEIESDAFWNP